MAFSIETRRAIRRRDRGNRGSSTSYEFGDEYDEMGKFVLNGSECSHLDHDPNSEFYDDIGNGRQVNRPTHFLEHLLQVDRLGNMRYENFGEYTTELVKRRLKPDEIAYLEWLSTMG